MKKKKYLDPLLGSYAEDHKKLDDFLRKKGLVYTWSLPLKKLKANQRKKRKKE